MTVPTASQTVGPYFGLGLDWPDERNLAGVDCRGDVIEVHGHVMDATGAGVNDAMIEIWQANAEGRYEHPMDCQNTPLDPCFRGHGRVAVDGTGHYCFRTIKPGRVKATYGGLQAPHICLQIFARGLLKQVHTRIYFGDEPEANATDAVLALVPPEGRGAPVAVRVVRRYVSDIRLQADVAADETVFFDY
jgi:protocatechuate 3,4-dioxygenase, alpha subunit